MIGWSAVWYVLSDQIFLQENLELPLLGVLGILDFYFEIIRVFKTSCCLNTLAWNNGIGLWFYFVGF